MKKKLLIGFVAVYLVLILLEYLEHSVLFASTYMSLPNLFRSPEDTKTWVVLIAYIVFAFGFTFIFSKGYEGKGMMEGVRYGFYVSLLTSVTYSFANYAAMPMPFSLALQRALIGVIQLIIYGVILSLVFVKKNTPSAGQM
jgi:hypothetical protein